MVNVFHAGALISFLFFSWGALPDDGELITQTARSNRGHIFFLRGEISMGGGGGVA